MKDFRRLLTIGSLSTLAGLLLLASCPFEAGAEEGGHPADSAESVSLFDHAGDHSWWLSAQSNVITQAHGSFPAAYTGTNSLKPQAEVATSSVATVYAGAEVGSRDEFLLDMEEAAGGGLSEALGVAGFPNLDVVRNPTLSKSPYLARLIYHHVFSLSDEAADPDRGPLGIIKTLPSRRIDLRVGKLSVVDFFDVDSIGSDSHLQFTNWTVDNNGAYDYAADTRGYTDAVILEYHDGPYCVRFGEALMPTIANGIDLDWDLGRNHAENLELEWRKGLIRGREGVVRVLGYENHANMGNYREAIDRFEAGLTSVPDIVATRRKGRTKAGFGLNVELELTGSIGVFGRLGWSDGKNESFAYTEVDNTFEVGGDSKGDAWGRPHDRIGLAFVSNGISQEHRDYLALGGLGFLLGDGGLTYGRESVVEVYYTAHIWRGVFIGPSVQHIENPGYNRDRGPALVLGFRIHTDL